MKQTFEEKKFRPATLELIDQANVIIEEYQSQSLHLSLRQLYYQFVSRDIIANKQTEYKRLGSIISDARVAGLIDWSALEDRGRQRIGRLAYGSPEGFLRSQLHRFHKDWWAGQDTYVEVWIEKDALTGVISQVCYDNDVDYFACRGYNSQTEAYNAGQRFQEQAEDGKRVVVLHLGDHDPSGIDMTRDNLARSELFSSHCAHTDFVEFRRLALNYDQVEQYSPPPNPTKMTDSRAEGYIRDYGFECWELDALEPSVISNLIQDELDTIIDDDIMDKQKAREASDKQSLQNISDNWSEIQDFLYNAGDGA